MPRPAPLVSGLHDFLTRQRGSELPKDLVYDPAQLSEVCGLTAGPAAILRDSGPSHWYEMFYGAWGKKGVPDGSSVACVWAINRATLAQ